METDRRLSLAKINIALMLNDARMALRDQAAQGQPATVQAGILLGVMAAGHVLDGHTADEAWAEVEPFAARLRAHTTTATGAPDE